MAAVTLSSMRRKLTFKVITLFIIVLSLILPQFPVSADTSLTITPITWNVIGLDSNNVNAGPNDFPIGARVCNKGNGSTIVTSVNFVWDDGQGDYTSSPSANAYINLRDGTKNSINNLTLNAGTCSDAYFEVIVNRDPNAYDKTRRYHISATDSGGSVSTITPRELYVEHLISQNRNSTNDMQVSLNGTTFSSIPPGGTMALSVGNTYWIKLVASTATQGYNQLEDFITLSNTIFQILSVQSTYSADSSGYVANSSDKLYADACLWDNDSNSLTYRSCIGSDGKVGGSITTTYKVKILSGAGTTQTLNTLIYDFSGSSFHYNSDFSTQARIAYITSPLSLMKSFTPVSISKGSTSTLSITIINSSESEVTGVSLTDTLPAGLTILGTPTTPQCGGQINSSPGSITLDGVMIPAKVGGINGVCTVIALVTSSTNGTYANTTRSLMVNGSDTGLTASANLIVADNVLPGGICGTLAEWKMTPGGTGEGTNPPGPVLSTKTVTTANASYGGTGLVTSLSTTNGNPVNSWKGTGWQKTDVVTEVTSPHFQFAISTNNYTSVNLQFDATILNANPTGPSKIHIYTSNNNSAGSYSLFDTATPIGSTFNTYGSYAVPFNSGGTTYYRLYGTSAQNSGAGDLYIDNIKFTGCGPAIQPTLTKVFNPSTIVAGTNSTLTFTLSNNNTSNLTSVAFSDTLPAGIQVASTPNASTTCAGATFNPAASATSLNFSGGTIPANGNCTAQVDVISTTAGQYLNISGYISSAESGTNTGAGGSASATLTVLAPPLISKDFSPNPIYAGNASTLNFTIQNPNAETALTGISFTDFFPANLIVSSPPASSQCGGSVSSTSGSITLSGGTIPAGNSCTVTVLTTSSTPGNYINNSDSVNSTNGGTGNTANATLVVEDVHPGISIQKQVSTSLSGPWTKSVNVIEGGDIYFKITIENIGDVPLGPVSVTDPTLDISSCIWPAYLPVGTSSIDPSASCLIGPIPSEIGNHSNTATANGTYSGNVFRSSPSTASYATTSLTLVKSVQEGNYSNVGDLLHYLYTISNSGDSVLALPAAVYDTNSTVTCPTTDSTGNNDSFLDPDESINCTASYKVSDFDLSVGSISNTAYAIIDSIRTNNAQAILYTNKPDLTVTKTNNTGGYGLYDSDFLWQLSVNNKGASEASFPDGVILLSDQLPAGATYSISSVDSFVGISNSDKIHCLISLSSLLTCSADGADVSIDATVGSFNVNLQVTPSQTGSLVNTATVDPDNNITEGAEGNNNGSDTVIVLPAKPRITKAFDPVSIAPSQTSTITFTISNPNDVALTNANFQDQLFNMAVSSNSIGGTCLNVSNNPTLSVGETSLNLTIPILPVSGCTLTIEVTSSVIGTHPNTASGVNTDQTSTGSPSDAVDLTVLDIPSITVKKSSTTTIINKTGAVSYSYVVTNAGNVTLNNISLSDNNDNDDMDCPETSLDPGESMTCSATHTVTQAELNTGGTLDNTVTASSLEAEDATDDLSIPINQDPLMSVEKSSTTININETGAVRYSYLVTNEGNVTLNNISLSDNNDNDDMDCPETSLDPGESMTCSATHTVTQTELNAGGTLDNTVTASSLEAEDATDDLSIPINQVPIIGLAKRLISTEKTSAGTYKVTFEFLIKNFGNVLLTDINVSDALTSVFPLPTTFEVLDVSSPDFSVNWSDPAQSSDYDGNGNNDLLSDGVDLPAGSEGKITLVVQVIPAEAGPFENTAIASGQPPSGERVVDESSDGTDADHTDNCDSCVNGDGDPTNNTQPTPVDFGTNIFDPPFGIKVVDPSGLPLLKWTMEWINNSNLVAQRATVHDPIPFGTTYFASGDPSGNDVPDGAPEWSTNVGVTCETTSSITSTSLCYYEGPTIDNPLGQIVWSGTLGPDFGITDPSLASNKITITFQASVRDGFSIISNEASIDSDLNGDGDVTDDGEQKVAWSTAEWNRKNEQVEITSNSKLPNTGFAPGRISILPEQPKFINYQNLNSNPWLEIPSLGVRSSIVGIPLIENNWDVSWLWNQTGWLQGSAYPTSNGNSILTSHVTLSDGTAGPFVNLSRMNWGQKVIIHSNGERFIYEVQSVDKVFPTDRSAFKHEVSSWLTLVTCQGYIEKDNLYQYRVLVRARLLQVEKDQSSTHRSQR